MIRAVLAAIFLSLAASAGAAEPSAEARAAARDAFRTFAEPFLGDWDIEIAEYDGTADKPVWTDRQRRQFRYSMARHMLEERATLRTEDGRSYEGGLHLTSYDAAKGTIVQHGFWLPTQASPLFRIEGRIEGKNLKAEMTIRTDQGEDRRPLVIRWLGPDEWVLEVTDDGPRGEYLRDRLIYRRANGH